jgi:hypothetical protein
VIGLLMLGLTVQAGGSADAPSILVQSSGGHFSARLSKAPGQERVADVLARWKLVVTDADGRQIWSCFHPAPAEGRRYLLAHDGSKFVIVDERYGDAQPVVELRGADGEVDKVFGGQLGLAPAVLRAAEPAGSWLAPGESSVAFTWVAGPFGPVQLLDLACIDGELHQIELASGLPLGSGGGQVPVRVEPVFVEDSLPPSRVPVVLRYSAPEQIEGDEALPIAIEGQHPNPGWKVFAFGLEPGGPDGRSVVITPRARPPMPGGLTVEQIEPFTARALLRGLPPGEHFVEVHGEGGLAGPPLRVRVRPGGVLARLHVTGGILGLDETVTLFKNGVVGIEANRPERKSLSYAAPRPFADARRLVTALPPLGGVGVSPGSDLMTYELTWRVGEQWLSARGDDGNLSGEMRRAIEAVRALAGGG